MRKKLRIIGIIVCSYLIFFIGRGMYYYWKYDGINVFITLSTQYSPISSTVSLYIDDKLHYKNGSLQNFYQSFRVKLPLGFHHLRVIIDGETFEESFIVFPVRWVYIQIQKYNIENYKADENWVYIDFTNTPTVIM